jgi:hypothetical protein
MAPTPRPCTPLLLVLLAAGAGWGSNQRLVPGEEPPAPGWLLAGVPGGDVRPCKVARGSMAVSMTRGI